MKYHLAKATPSKKRKKDVVPSVTLAPVVVPAVPVEGAVSEDGGSASEDGGGGGNKKKKARTTFTGRQIFELEKQFEVKKYLSSSERADMAKLLNVTETQA
ncbi:hypothetical protein B566_EDAN015034 [Ephemera danica]|nr:hypothetical protein B566_EDAN015034 [Ephemera danica]